MIATAVVVLVFMLALQVGLRFVIGTSYTVVCNATKSAVMLVLLVCYSQELVMTIWQIAHLQPVTTDADSIRMVAIVYGSLDLTATMLNTKHMYASTIVHHAFVVTVAAAFCVMLFDFPCANNVAWYLIWSCLAILPNACIAVVKYAEQLKLHPPLSFIEFSNINYNITLTINWVGTVVLFRRAVTTESLLRLLVGVVIVMGWVVDDVLFVRTLQRWRRKYSPRNKTKCH